VGEKLKRVSQMLGLLARHARPGLLAGPDDEGVPGEGGAGASGSGAGGSGGGAGAARLASDLEDMGPTFIKFGQLLSTRYDLLPGEYTDALARLQDDVDPIPADEVRARIEEELGLRVRDLYSRFDDEPLAAASLGQVHRATTVTGREVVVKVLRPDVRTIVHDDMELLGQVASLVDDKTPAGPRLGTATLLAQFRRSLADELDYRKELANLTRFRELAADEDDLVVPEPLARFSTDQVLTMEYVPGRKVTDVGSLGLLDVDGPALAEALFRFMLRTLLDEGLLHADPHPGNLLITPEGRLGIIDLGMVARIPRRVQAQLVKLLLAIGEGDGEQVATILSGMGHPLPDHDAVAFRDEVAHLVSATLTLGSELQAGSVLVELARLSGAHGLRPPAEMSLVGKALLNLDQTVMHLDPDFSPGEAIKANLVTLIGAGLSVSPGTAIAGALEAKEFAENLPRRANRVLDALADGELAVRVNAFDEDRLLSVAQRLANRVTMGIVLAAITVAAALMMGIEGGPRLLGYPALAVVFFLIAALSGLGLVLGIYLTDRRTRKRAEAHERDRAHGRTPLV
ncbi:MAG: AarF/UbiB family protein, partial [Propionibacteriaceae bacterium]|nr:AarF/UbiB family protein [Propionibacteriaceae bacterium]